MNKKTMNKLKLSLITIATLTTANVNAQTFYQCVREACPSGQYFDGVNCKSLPTQTACASGKYFDGVKCLDFPTTGTTETPKLSCLYEFTYRSAPASGSCSNVSYLTSKNGIEFYPSSCSCQNFGGYVQICQFSTLLAHGDSINGKTCDNGNMK